MPPPRHGARATPCGPGKDCNLCAKGFQNGSDAAQAAAQEAAANDGRSVYTARPAAAPTYRPEVPTLNVPVQVESQDGAVTIEGDSEGYTSATIE